MFTYLASPYSGNEQENYEAAAKFTAERMAQGHVIFSPIVHCHQIAIDYNLPGDFNFWQNYNFAMLDIADELMVLKLPGWERSKGVAGEIDFAANAGIPVTYIEPAVWGDSILGTAPKPFDLHQLAPDLNTRDTHMNESITNTLIERHTRYGDFAGHASITQSLKSIMWNAPKWDTLSPAQMESLEMIVHKIGRILNGDPNYHDSWHDIEGYARLVSETLEHEQS
jgi:hypothetical protein